VLVAEPWGIDDLKIGTRGLKRDREEERASARDCEADRIGEGVKKRYKKNWMGLESLLNVQVIYDGRRRDRKISRPHCGQAVKQGS